MNVREHNRNAWNKQVEYGNEWTIPVSAEEVAAARSGKWDIFLTPSKPVPKHWFLPLEGARVLCLASGGGQQAPILAAAGAKVTVFDNSPRQLEQDRLVARRDGLSLDTVEGDMRDLSTFSNDVFDLVILPVSNSFVPEVASVWREAYRVLRSGGSLLSGFSNPVVYIFDETAYGRGELLVVHTLPYADTDALSSCEIAKRAEEGVPLEFSHTLEDLIRGQIDAGFVIAGFYEDRYPPDKDPLAKYMSTFVATRAFKGTEDKTDAQ